MPVQRVMPLGSPIGSGNKGTQKNLFQILIDGGGYRLYCRCRNGKPSQACEAMEMGAAAVIWKYLQLQQVTFRRWQGI